MTPDDDAPRPDPGRPDPGPDPSPLDALVALGELVREARSSPPSVAPGPAAPSPAARSTSGPGPGTGRGSAGGDRGNYLGGGLYRYRGGVARKVSVYLSPELVPALKAAGASRRDPRGTDMSEIVEALVREAGYGDG